MNRQISSITFFCLFFYSFVALTQTPSSKPDYLGDEETNILLRNEGAGGLFAHQNGWGGFYRRGKNLTGYKKRMLEVEFATMKHPKEYSIVNPSFDGASSFVYGKMNSVFLLRGGYGRQKVLFSKADRLGVEVKYSLYGGASFAFAKPVYLDIVHPSSIPYSYDVTSERYDPAVHRNIEEIYGKSSFTTGLGSTVIYPGLYAKFALNFEYGMYHNSIKALETGVVIDGYPRNIPMMAYNKNRNYFVSFYIAFMYGSKW